MKDINLFTDEIIEKVKAKKKKKARKVLLISSVFCLVIAFLIMYSNIIPLYGYDYEKYTSIMINEVYASDDEKTIFTFTNEKNAIFSINNVPYSLRTTNNKNNEYEFDATKIENVEKEKNMQEYLDKTTIKIEFKEGGATIKANVYGIDLNIDVKIYKNTKMESGVWKYFNVDI